MCLCDAAPQGCSMQFLKNNKTMETLRQFNDSCYHQTGNVCKGDECSCSSDCMNFTFKYNTTENRTGDIFSCQMRIEEQEENWTDNYVYDSAIFNGTGKIIHLYSFPHSWFITGYVTRVTQLVPLVEQELVTRPEFTSGFQWCLCCSFFSFLRCFCRSLFVIFTFGHCNVWPSLIYGFWLLSKVVCLIIWHKYILYVFYFLYRMSSLRTKLIEPHRW